MRIRNYVILFLCLILAGHIGAQGFISLDWKNPAPLYIGFDKIKTDMPGFAGASYSQDACLPYYTYTMELGRDYQSYDYNITIEYPEFASLTKKEIAAIESIDAFLPSYPEIKKNISVSAKHGTLIATFIPLVYKDGIYQRINSFKLSVVKEEKRSLLRSAETAVKNKYADSSVLDSGKWIKVRVTDTGVYQITNAELSKMGFSNPSKVRLYGYGGRLLSENLTKDKIDDLQEIPLWRESGYILFYGYGTVRWEKSGSVYIHAPNHYSTYGCYFLTESEDAPMEFPKETSLSESGATLVTTFPDYAVYEKDEFAWLEAGRKLFESYDYKNGNTKSYTFSDLTGITDAAGVVTVAFSAYDKESSTTVSVAVNGTNLSGVLSIGKTTSEYNKATLAEANFAWTGSKNEKTIVALTHNRNSGVSGHLDFIRLNYTRNLSLYNSYTSFRSEKAGKMKFAIANANENTCVWNVTNAGNYRQMDGTLSNGTYSFVYNTSVNDEFVVVNPKGTFKKVEVVGEVANQNLHKLKEVDMIIITPPNAEYIKQAQRLAEVHEKYDGLVTEVVTSEQVYNEFSSGTPDATAYRWLMKMLYDRAEEGKEPKYLLLFADASFDNRLLTANWKKFTQDNLLLCFGSNNSVSETNSYVSDDYFGMLDDGDAVNIDRLFSYAVDLGVGRFPVRSSIEAKDVVDKIIAYIENKNAGSWKNSVAFLGDDGKNNDGNIHMEQADAVANLAVKYNSSLLVKKVYWDAYKMEKSAIGNSYPEVKKRILELFKEGLLFFNYTGHGGPQSFSDELVINTKDVNDMVTSKPPFWFTAACDIAPIDRIDVSMGETAFLKGAAIGLLTTTRTVYPDPNCRMDSVLVRFLFSKTANERPRLGDAIRKTKAHISGLSDNAQVNDLQYVFIGDPALRLSIPEYKMVIDEFNGVGVNSTEISKIKAGGIVKVKGRILNGDGDVAEDFSGALHSKVLDNEEKIITHNNNGLAPRAFEYYDRTKTIYAGSDSVRAGVFEFQFPVPLDINYSDESGLLNLYAVNADKTMEGQGVFADFLVGGTENGAMDTDSLGPKINIYLNTPEFMSGEKVNTTPYIIAELEDEDGINATGNGIGHDIVAIIDNSPLYTYVLNNYYESVFGDYTKGIVRFKLPEMSEGRHKLLFRAWDVKNNSSSVLVEFEVIDGLIVGLDITCTKSPAKDNTMFILTHDRPYAELEVGITVYDYAGRTLWTHQETGTADGNYYYVDWDLTTNSGQRLVPGIYLYKATISSEGSKEATQSRKIVIVGQ